MKPETLFSRVKDRLKGRQGWWFYHFEDDRIVSPFKRVPLKQAMMVDDRKVLYLPIGKNACSSLKTLVAELGGLPRLQPGDDIHVLLDKGPNNLFLLHRSETDIQTMLSDPSWMRFAVLRAPYDRLVSVYVEKFVRHRTQAGVRITIDPVLKRALNKDHLTEEDYERGISFRMFAQDLMSEPIERLDPHWRPQSLFLDHINYTHLYTVDNLSVLKQDLEWHLGEKVVLPYKNAVRTRKHLAQDGPCVADLVPTDIEAAEHLPVERYIDKELRAMLRPYYALDETLYNLVSQMNQRLNTGHMLTDPPNR